MTERFNALIVMLEKDTREDDAEPLMNAIRQLRGVLAVEGNVVGLNAVVSDQRARQEWRDKLIKLLWPDSK